MTTMTETTPTSDGRSADIASADIDALMALAGDLDPAGLDDAVHDCCDTTASERYNTDDSLTDLTDDDAAEVAYAETSTIGSTINNSGIRAQIAFLIAELGMAGARNAIEDAHR